MGLHKDEGGSAQSSKRMRPRAASVVPLATSFLKDAGVEPFYDMGQCPIPAAWNGGSEGACSSMSIERCNDLFRGSRRIECYCGAMGVSSHVCTPCSFSYAYEAGLELLESCIEWADQAHLTVQAPPL